MKSKHIKLGNKSYLDYWRVVPWRAEAAAQCGGVFGVAFPKSEARRGKSRSLRWAATHRSSSISLEPQVRQHSGLDLSPKNYQAQIRSLLSIIDRHHHLLPQFTSARISAPNPIRSTCHSSLLFNCQMPCSDPFSSFSDSNFFRLYSSYCAAGCRI
ncbi:hypothetical protein DM860_001230 [Cuscuta australis]|uniref:Uncharacterized protein n=1 Tax=Cuscuta australis TaxID=267555 RepID=A0A328DUI8_9ASTE|nr:hypothetical protein DM860_001230 [Cuscuta australis]